MICKRAPPAQMVAQSFVSVYYQIIERIPDRLPQLYGECSMLSHGSTCAIGSERIAAIVHDLPLTGARADLLSTDVQQTDFGFVVLVQGMMPENKIFSQVFMLEKVGNSVEHFLLHNDVFRFLPEDKEAAAKTCKILPLRTFLDPGEGVDVTSASFGSESDTATGSSSPSSMIVDGIGELEPQEIVLKGNQTVSQETTSCETAAVKNCTSLESQCTQEVPWFQGWPVLGAHDDSVNTVNEPTHSTAKPLNISHVEATSGFSSSSSTVSTENRSSVDNSEDARSASAKSENQENVFIPVRSGLKKSLNNGTSSVSSRNKDLDISIEESAVQKEDNNIPEQANRKASTATVPKSWPFIACAENRSDRGSEQAKNSCATLPPIGAMDGNSNETSRDRATRKTNCSGPPSANVNISVSCKNKKATKQGKNDPIDGRLPGIEKSLGHCELPVIPPSNSKALTPQKSSYLTALKSSNGSPLCSPPVVRASTSSGLKTSMSPAAKKPATIVSPKNSILYSEQNSGNKYKGNRRMFGPTAVVHLRPLQNKLHDVKLLTKHLREEFSQYGYAVRNVDVKVALGIAFIEYKSAEAVPAACAAWRYGARKEGLFAGIPLSVSEKRGSRGRRPG